MLDLTGLAEQTCQVLFHLGDRDGPIRSHHPPPAARHPHAHRGHAAHVRRLAPRAGQSPRHHRRRKGAGQARHCQRRHRKVGTGQIAARAIPGLPLEPGARRFGHLVQDQAPGRSGPDSTFCRPRSSWRLPRMLFALVVGLPLGILAAIKSGSWVDHLVTAGVSVGRFDAAVLVGADGAVPVLLQAADPARPRAD